MTFLALSTMTADLFFRDVSFPPEVGPSLTARMGYATWTADRVRSERAEALRQAAAARTPEDLASAVERWEAARAGAEALLSVVRPGTTARRPSGELGAVERIDRGDPGVPWLVRWPTGAEWCGPQDLRGGYLQLG